MTALYTLAGQLIELQKLSDVDSDVVIADTLDAVEGEFNKKAEALVSITINMDADVTAIDKEIGRLTDRKKAIANRQESLKEYLRMNMEASGINNISCPLFSITCAKGRSIAIIEDESLLPDEMVNVSTEIVPDKKAILEALKRGDDVPGARLGTSKTSIRIK
jgi:hypothetical protein